VVRRNGHRSLMTMVERGLAGGIGRVLPQRKEKNATLESLMKKEQNRNGNEILMSTEKKSSEKDGECSMETTKDNMITSSIDMVNQPPHYASSKIECIEAMEAMTSQNRKFKITLTAHGMYCWQVIFKYIWRFPYKDNPIEDLKKAQYYLDRLIKTMEKKK